MGNSEFFIAPRWVFEFDTLKAGFTLPVLGNQALTRKSVYSGRSTGDNRRQLAGLLDVDLSFVFSPHQIHSDIVIEVTRENCGSGAYGIEDALQGDAVITNQKNMLLITSWADCIPVLLFDPETDWIASIHSGWKSTRLAIVKKVVEILRKKGVDPANLFCAVGPGIRDCCYEVSPEFKGFFPEYSGFFRDKTEKVFFNLQEVVYTQLIESGINPQKIEKSGGCTCCGTNPWFFSFRKDADSFEGQAAFIVNKND